MRGWRSGIAAAAAVLALSACNDGRATADPAAPGDATASQTPATQASRLTSPPSDIRSPTPVPAVTGTDSAAAEAFVAYWAEELGFAYRTGDTSGLRRASASDCSACARYIEEIERVYGLGHTLEGGALSLTEISAPPDSSGEAGVIVNAFVEQEPLLELDDRGRQVGSTGGGEAKPFRLAAQIQNGDWKMAGIAQV